MADANVALYNKTVEQYKDIQTELQGLVTQRTQYESQLNETGMCKEELEKLDEDTPVYKLIGPALVKQDPEEARANIKKRLAFIEGEMKRIEGAMAAKQAEMEVVRKQIGEMRAKIEAASGGGAGASEGRPAARKMMM
uniref:Prefoldin subunit 6 n=1 Tax=Bicosoecida sp. CB-2014 TaxID=1486930 RepID=A0A7S1CKP6_9STRA|eukprot:CAMPEP_0203814176 /NCGR_PEP_ID=MMETSP0115-20131106/5130_1 /ASSEMBLY_ACC=CAM_ASM_000227 /TAXON_ID=33651 /ORGANISM="Bicosoecid sp, Strain ms1" /LENGTH=137 /DNA_ID=CAMNT_0050723053 /DNA_START=34 /DNA_END=447 /DNA_ORIENTATION=+